VTKQKNGLTLSWRVALTRLRKARNAAQTALLLLGIPTGHHKVFAIGFNKTATTSLHGVFQKLGMVSLHETYWRDPKRTLVFLPYQCFSDGIPGDFSVFDKRFKRSKFILNIRDLDEWLDSRLEHIRQAKARNATIITPKWDRTDAAVKHWIVERTRFHLEVLDYFRDRPNDLLVLNYIRDPDPGQKIADFLGINRRVGKQHVRSTNEVRTQGVLRNEARIHRCLAELGVPESAWKADIHCPITGGTPSPWPFDSSELTERDLKTL